MLTKYKTILADPPWRYDSKKVALSGWGKEGGCAQHYQTMSVNEICSLPIIKQIRNKDCVLFLWVTFPMLPHEFEVMRAWGFKYKATIIWVKTKCLSMGFWFRSQGELCLIGKKGNIKAFRSKEPNIFFAPISKHSRKPEQFFRMIDNVIPRPAIELFAREKREGWDAWGDEVS